MAKSNRASTSTSGDRSRTVSVQDFTEAAFGGIIRALEARKLKGPIIYGMIFDPRLPEITPILRGEQQQGR